jgi:hypothetical protein
MLNKNCDRTVAKAALVDPSPDVFGDFVRPLTIRADFKLLVMDTHKLCGCENITRNKNSRALRARFHAKLAQSSLHWGLRKELIATSLIIR